MKKVILLTYYLLSFVPAGIVANDSLGLIYKNIPDYQSLLPKNSHVVDEVLVVIYGPERTRVVTRMEVERLSIDGRKRSLEDLITEELIYQDGIKFKIQIDESVVDRYIANIRKQYNLSLEDVKGIFKQSGYTYEEGREQLRMMYATNAMVDNIVMTRLHVSADDVLAYYSQNPVIQEATYTLQMVLVPFEAWKSHVQQQEEIATKIKHGNVDLFAWNESFLIKEHEIAPHMDFIKQMTVGSISMPLESGNGFEIYRLVERIPQTHVPLANRYKDIEATLRQPQFEKKFAEYKTSLMSPEFATLVYYGNKS